MADSAMIEATGLTKRYGATVALDGIDLEVAAGSILSVLGPNGAGKTTAVRILTTLALPDGGNARVGGFDVVTQAADVRRQIGVTAQDATLDHSLTGRQNLVMVGELSGLRPPTARARAAELLDEFGLTDAADRLTRGYSGGMRRRLDLAASMVANPPVLFLDEPTTGLDPTSRLRVWEVIRQLVAEGVTVFLTTQYLEEADTLADQIVVIGEGRIIAQGTSGELKATTGAARLDVTLTVARPDAVDALRPFVEGPMRVTDDGRRIRVSVRSGSGIATKALRVLDHAGILVDDVEVRQPSLDDVFLSLTAERAPDTVAVRNGDGPLP